LAYSLVDEGLSRKGMTASASGAEDRLNFAR
jgi:hypothetical protein